MHAGCIKWFALSGLLFACLTFSGCGPLLYSAKPIQAWVVDAETKQPLKDVNLTANWQLERGTMGGYVPVGQIMIMETVTDENGRFYFPAWGPKFAAQGIINSQDPQILLFKNGYHPGGADNSASENLSPMRTSDSDGKTLELKPFKGDSAQYLNELERLTLDLGSLSANKPCEWRHVPRMISAVHKAAVEIESTGVVVRPLQAFLTLPDPARCGLPSSFFENLQK
jgi:hypothetical protein